MANSVRIASVQVKHLYGTRCTKIVPYGLTRAARTRLTVEQTCVEHTIESRELFGEVVRMATCHFKLGVAVNQSVCQPVNQSVYRSSVEFFPSVPRPRQPRPAHPRPVLGDPAGTAPERPDSPNYALRRAGALAVALAAVLLVGIIILLAGSGGRPASASRAEPAFTSPAAVHVAAAGDSLWSIAQANHGDVSIDRYVDALIDLNGGTDIAVGQAVRLP